MISDVIRSIVSGILGAIGAGWLSNKWRHWMPSGCGSKSKSVIMRENAGRIRMAGWLALAGILVGLALDLSGHLFRYDWRGLGIAVGLAGGLPLLWLAGSSIGGGRRKFREGLVALAISQKTPIPILIGLSALCIAGGIAAAIGLVRSPPSHSEQVEGSIPEVDSQPQSE